ncbi:hypothetical protein EPUS_00526 [Endocarpon pusillum Z07020]|uniref:Response regulatory domain-containing protein n=1 Tax=Endocarpon pusillum (strain Z07020 / HMAS-L-300199) TaxID=1263415 RepID=U1G2M6_ENDPU|nr:uncharacterized protein EPUS_00526 [Endocarpon pusillum Z07020]ERF71537.1 hypothetical protein EPUS_00526 [Endocarpon pusillum Z07020]
MPLHKCQVCGKILSRSTKLSEHIRSHTGQKPFRCDICKAHFSRSYDLTKHKERHSGSYKYKCEGEENGVTWGCGKGFHKKGDLNRHLKRGNAEQCRRARQAVTPTRSEAGERPTQLNGANPSQSQPVTALEPRTCKNSQQVIIQDRLRAAQLAHLRTKSTPPGNLEKSPFRSYYLSYILPPPQREEQHPLSSSQISNRLLSQQPTRKQQGCDAMDIDGGSVRQSQEAADVLANMKDDRSMRLPMISAATDTDPSTITPNTSDNAFIHERGNSADQREQDRQQSGVIPRMQDQMNTSQASATPAEQFPSNDGTGSSQKLSLVQNSYRGMTWEGLSRGSWIQADLIVSGTPPYSFQSPSYHFPSDLPKVEANFIYCGRTLPTVHELMGHFGHQQALLPTAETSAIPESRSKSAPPHSEEAGSSIALSGFRDERHNIGGITIRQRTPRILLVEDDPTCRKFEGKFLFTLKCEIDNAVDCLEAVNKVSEVQASLSLRYDLIMIDIIMPNLDGVTSSLSIRQFDRTPIIAITADFRADDIQMYFRYGMDGVLQKPYTRKSLLDMLEEHFSHLKKTKSVIEDSMHGPTNTASNLGTPDAGSNQFSYPESQLNNNITPMGLLLNEHWLTELPISQLQSTNP